MGWPREPAALKHNPLGRGAGKDWPGSPSVLSACRCVDSLPVLLCCTTPRVLNIYNIHIYAPGEPKILFRRHAQKHIYATLRTQNQKILCVELLLDVNSMIQQLRARFRQWLVFHMMSFQTDVNWIQNYRSDGKIKVSILCLKGDFFLVI